MTTLYFTGTGNSLYVAKRIGDKILSIPQLIKDGIFHIKEEAVGIVFPCYGFSVPEIVEDYIINTQIDAKYVFAVMTYCGWPISGLHHMEKILSKKGVQLHYANEVSMVNNCLITYTVEEQLRIKKPETKINEIITDIHQRKKQIIQKNILSNAASASFNAFEKRFQISIATYQRNFIINNSCTSCGVCQKVCPASNITVVPGEKPMFDDKCVSCLACIHQCPQNAIHHKREKSRLKYRNPNITLAEIIQSNNQK